MKIPLLGTAMRMGKFVPVSRGHSREDAIQSVEVAKDALAHGLNIMIFPEGTRSPDGKMLPFKKGAFFLAADTGGADRSRHYFGDGEDDVAGEFEACAG